MKITKLNSKLVLKVYYSLGCVSQPYKLELNMMDAKSNIYIKKTIVFLVVCI